MSASFTFSDSYGAVHLWWDSGNNPSFSGFGFGAWEEVFTLTGWDTVAISILTSKGLCTGAVVCLAEARDFAAKVGSYLALAAERGSSDDYYCWSRGLQSVQHAEEYFRIYEQRFSASTAKRQITKRRRAVFNSLRDALVLQMLDAGHPYVCAEPSCKVCSDLTVDHVIPLSRGGTDDINNLQFMCGPHNSAKGARQIAGLP